MQWHPWPSHVPSRRHPSDGLAEVRISGFPFRHAAHRGPVGIAGVGNLRFWSCMPYSMQPQKRYCHAACSAVHTMHWRTAYRSTAGAPPVCMPCRQSTACRGSWSKWERRWRPCAFRARASGRACSEGTLPSLEPCPNNATSNVLARHTNAAYYSACIYMHAQINHI